MRLAAPGYRLRSHYYAYGSNVRNCFRSLHTKDPADTLHPESRASRRQDGVEVSRFYSLSAPSCIATRAVAQEQEGRHRVRQLEPVPFSTSCERNETSVSECEYTPHPCMHAQSRRETSTHARDSRVQTSRLEEKSPNPSSTRKGSSSSVDDGSQEHLSRLYPISTTSRTSSDFYKNYANRFGSSSTHIMSLIDSNSHTHTHHDMSQGGPQTLGDGSPHEADQVGCRESIDWMTDSSVYHLRMALEAAQLDAAAASGDATKHPQVVLNWLGTHPDAISKRIWAQATETPSPLGDGFDRSSDHETYHAPSQVILSFD